MIPLRPLLPEEIPADDSENTDLLGSILSRKWYEKGNWSFVIMDIDISEIEGLHPPTTLLSKNALNANTFAQSQYFSYQSKVDVRENSGSKDVANTSALSLPAGRMQEPLPNTIKGSVLNLNSTMVDEMEVGYSESKDVLNGKGKAMSFLSLVPKLRGKQLKKPDIRKVKVWMKKSYTFEYNCV